MLTNLMLVSIDHAVIALRIACRRGSSRCKFLFQMRLTLPYLRVARSVVRRTTAPMFYPDIHQFCSAV